MGLAAAETLLWAFDIGPEKMLTKRMLIRAEPQPLRFFQCYTSNPNGEFMAVPDTSEGLWVLRSWYDEDEIYPLSRLSSTPWCVEYDLSPDFMRNQVLSPEVPPGVLRIATIGDSFVFGEGVPSERTLVTQLGEDLGPGFEIVNLGVPGLDTAGEVAKAPALIESLDCKRAIVVFIPNDIQFSDELIAHREAINDLIGYRDDKLDQYHSSKWLGWSRLARFVQPALDMREISERSIQWYLDAYNPTYNVENLVALKANFQQLALIPDCRTVMVVYPLMVGLQRDYPLASIHELVARMANDVGLPVLDLAPAFAGQKTESMWVHTSDYHPNGKAHAIAAAEIARWLREDQPWFLEPDNKVE